VPTGLHRRRSRRLGSNSISLPNPRESTAKSEDLRGVERHPSVADLQGFFI
jgi:hypothetical protein